MDTKVKKLIAALLVVLLGSLGAWLFLGRPATGIDDADIFFVYARNFADGHGFVYNIGGERVEGFTSLLWTLICSAGFLIFQSLELPLYMLNLVSGTAVVWICLKRTDRPWLFLLFLAAGPAWFAWCQITLMESGLWCLLITLLGLAVLDRRRIAILILLPLLVITRPESMLWGAWVLVLIFLRAEPGRRLKATLFPALVFAAALALLIGFRLWYFGYPVPNTYYAKVSPGLVSNICDGTIYFLRYAGSNAVVLLALSTLLLALLKPEKKYDKGFYLSLFLLPGIGIPVLVGGDHFGAFRFYQPLWPLLCLIVVDKWPVLMNRFTPRVEKFALAAIVLSGWLLFPSTANLKQEFRIAREGRENGQTLAAMFNDLDPLPSIAVITAGGIKYTYPGQVLDVLGLNSTEMAHMPGAHEGFKGHASFNREIFYTWKPNILLRGDSHEFDRLVLKNFHDELQFKALYQEGALTRNGLTVSAFYARDFLARLGDSFTIE